MVGIYLCWTRRTSGSESEGDLCSSPPPSLVGAWCGQVVSDFGIRRGLSPNFFLRLHTFTFRGPLQRAVQQRLRASSSSSSSPPSRLSHWQHLHRHSCIALLQLHCQQPPQSPARARNAKRDDERRTDVALELKCSLESCESPPTLRIVTSNRFLRRALRCRRNFFCGSTSFNWCLFTLKSYFLYFYFFLGRIWSSFVRSVRLDQLKIVPQFIQHNKGSTEKKSVFFRNKS